MKAMGRVAAALTLGGTTGVAATAPMWILLSVVFLSLQDASSFIAIGTMFIIGPLLFVGAATAWGLVVAQVASVRRGPLVRCALRLVLLAIAVGIGMDLSQAFIHTVEPWHRLAIHAVFTITFTVGLAVFMGVTAAVTERRVAELRAGQSATAWWDPVAGLAAAGGAFAAAVGAVQLGWAVQHEMAVSMLWPLYLVRFAGTACGGAVLGWRLPREVDPGTSEEASH